MIASISGESIGQGALESKQILLLHELSLFNPNGRASQNDMALVNISEIGTVVALVTCC